MSKGLISVVTALFLTVSLNADSLKDSVAKKAQEAIDNPSKIDTKSAQEEVSRVEESMYNSAIYNADKFKKEALKDRASMIQSSVAKESEVEKAKFKIASKDITLAFNKTVDAIEAITKDKIDEASKALDEANVLFEKALKKNPDLKLVPIANTITIKAFEGNSTIIKKALDKAKDDITHYNTQEARAILTPMQDEMDILTVYLPMNIYPVAVKKASEALKAKKVQEAMAILTEGLSAKVIDIVIIPLPLLIAHDLVEMASKLDKSRKEDAIALLDTAKEELLKAYLLGYTTKHSKAYKDLNSQIDAIKKEIAGANNVEEPYKKINSSFNQLLKDTRADVVKSSSQK